VLDNFEQVLAAGSHVADLLAHCAQLKILVTSRAVLGLSGEHVYAVPPLRLPTARAFHSLEEPASEAVRLFAERARAARADFVLTPDNWPAVVGVCRRLEGIPLAIELAAARVRLLSPRALLARLDRALPLLDGGPRDAPARQRTMRDAIAWSYELLAPEERERFRHLGVFVGGCAPEAVAAVYGASGDPRADVLAALGCLVDHSLLRQEEQEDGEPRL